MIKVEALSRGEVGGFKVEDIQVGDIQIKGIKVEVKIQVINVEAITKRVQETGSILLGYPLLISMIRHLWKRVLT
ncbi:hypothetical protein N7463_008666 [Penicillium fimorum]|uniref:Uncharacterized protein n=1 Tax=Penicillium fimorum TaxID=1882269 RepID=A0A9W9XPB2_9EURO|nr:hypothetical protein N7463_008666 [Penicillium fimorum]